MRLIRSLAPLCALIATFATAAPAQSAYVSYPALPPTPTCSTTYSTLATFQTALNTDVSTAKPCLAVGTYAGLLTINRTAAGTITGAGAGTAYGASITGGVTLNGGGVNLRGLDVQNTGSGNFGDCVRKAAGNTTQGTFSYSKIHNCYRNGVNMARPAMCSPAPCPPPATGYASNLTLNHDWVYNVGNTDTTGSNVILRGDSSGSEITNSELYDTPNDFILTWGANNSIQQVKCHANGVPAVTSHPDCVQSWHLPDDDGAEGLPADNLLVERVRAYHITGPNAHFLMLSGNIATVTVRWNELNDVGSPGDHAIELGSTAAPFGNITTARVQNNMFYDAGHVEFNNSSSGTIYSNIFNTCSDTTGPWVISAGSTVAKTNNTGDGGTACTATGTNAANRNPLFVAPGSDFHLQAGSPEHNTGAGTPGGLDIDNQTTPIGTINRGSDED